MKQIIMTSPVSFDVTYSINPWMEGQVGNIDKVKAMQQWNEVRNAIVAAGADVIVMPKAPDNCPDAVFTANAGLIFNGAFIPSRFKNVERQLEETFFINWFGETFNVVSEEFYETRAAHTFEGAGDALFDSSKPILWYGFGFRSSLAFKAVLDQHFDDTQFIVRGLELVDPRFYHLDTCFCPLDTGELLWYPAAFSEHSQYTIRTWYEHNAIEVSEDDAAAFACNAVSVGRSIVLPIISDTLKERLEDGGYKVYQVDTSEFQKSGGSCKCLTLEVNV